MSSSTGKGPAPRKQVKKCSLKILHWNVRSIQSNFKQQKIMDAIKSSYPEGLDFVSLVETKLKDKLSKIGGISHQTKPSERGGCWQLARTNKCVKVKALGSNILWSIGYFEGHPIHLITAYLPSHVKDEADQTLRDLKWIVYKLFKRNPNAYCVITGDFNKHHLADSTMEKYKMKKLLAENESTHLAGNSLDQIWTNLSTSQIELNSLCPNGSDHLEITATLSFTFTGKYKASSTATTFESQADIRTANKDKTAMALLSDDHTLF
jgi:exonuclease III